MTLTHRVDHLFFNAGRGCLRPPLFLLAYLYFIFFIFSLLLTCYVLYFYFAQIHFINLIQFFIMNDFIYITQYLSRTWNYDIRLISIWYIPFSHYRFPFHGGGRGSKLLMKHLMNHELENFPQSLCALQTSVFLCNRFIIIKVTDFLRSIVCFKSNPKTYYFMPGEIWF